VEHIAPSKRGDDEFARNPLCDGDLIGIVRAMRANGFTKIG
jgi:hypothetical protein